MRIPQNRGKISAEKTASPKRWIGRGKDGIGALAREGTGRLARSGTVGMAGHVGVIAELAGGAISLGALAIPIRVTF